MSLAAVRFRALRLAMMGIGAEARECQRDFTLMLYRRQSPTRCGPRTDWAKVDSGAISWIFLSPTNQRWYPQ
jgi:hypothetical protein